MNRFCVRLTEGRTGIHCSRSNQRAVIRILILTLIMLTVGCLKHAVREQTDDDSTEGKSDIRQLEDRLGV